MLLSPKTPSFSTRFLSPTYKGVRYKHTSIQNRVLHRIFFDASYVVLKHVQSYGTEGRLVSQTETPPSVAITPFMQFRGKGIADLSGIDEEENISAKGDTAAPAPASAPDTKTKKKMKKTNTKTPFPAPSPAPAPSPDASPLPNTWGSTAKTAAPQQVWNTERRRSLPPLAAHCGQCKISICITEGKTR